MEETYRIERMDFSNPLEMQCLVNLQNIVYKGTHTFSSKGFKHWYLDNPNGRVISYNAMVGDEMAAHYAIIPINMKIGGRVVKGTLSMATVTHPEHRGKGLFKRLAQQAYKSAKEEGYEFVVGVANANSFPGFIKHLGFYEVGMLDVMIGIKDSINLLPNKSYKVYWDEQTIQWRIRSGKYFKRNNLLLGTFPLGRIKRCPFLNTYLGVVPDGLTDALQTLKSSCKLFRPFNLYVGMGSNARTMGYFKVPSFIKHSPFHLIFLDLTGGDLPRMTKDNVFFQLMDFDVA